MTPSLLDALYGASLPRKLKLARNLYSEHGGRLLSQTSLRVHLDACLVLYDEVRLCMEGSCMPAFCRACARSSRSGGCCSFAMTDENDAVLLLLNLLTGNPVALQRQRGPECLFLGEAGCSLRFKPIFCLNYLCRQLRAQLPEAELRKLERATGRLLQQQFVLEQLLLRLLHKFAGT